MRGCQRLSVATQGVASRERHCEAGCQRILPCPSRFGTADHFQIINNTATAKRPDRLVFSGEHFDRQSGWFLLSPRSHDPADPPAHDIRHTAEVGIALAMDGRAKSQCREIIDKIVPKQGDSCAQGSWRSSDAAACADPLSTVICAELMARGRDWHRDDPNYAASLDSSLAAALAYLEQTATSRGWRYELLSEPFWETWGASIVGFRLRNYLTSELKARVIACLVQEIERTDFLLGPWTSVQRSRLLVRYLSALVAVNCTDPRMTQWREAVIDLWLALDPDTQDVSTKLHLAYLLSHEVLI